MDARELAERIVDDEVVDAGWFRANRAGLAGRCLLVLTPFDLVLVRPWRAIFGRGEQQRWKRDSTVSRPAADLRGLSSDVALELLDAQSRRSLASLSPLDDSAVALIAALWGMAEPATTGRWFEALSGNAPTERRWETRRGAAPPAVRALP